MKPLQIMAIAVLGVLSFGLSKSSAEVSGSVDGFKSGKFFQKYHLQPISDPDDFQKEKVSYVTSNGQEDAPPGIKIQQFKGDNKDYLVTILFKDDIILFQGASFTVVPGAPVLTETLTSHQGFVIDLIDESLGYKQMTVSLSLGQMVKVIDAIGGFLESIKKDWAQSKYGMNMRPELIANRYVWAQEMFRNEKRIDWLFYAVEFKPSVKVLPQMISRSNHKFFEDPEFPPWEKK